MKYFYYMERQVYVDKAIGIFAGGDTGSTGELGRMELPGESSVNAMKTTNAANINAAPVAMALAA